MLHGIYQFAFLSHNFIHQSFRTRVSQESDNVNKPTLDLPVRTYLGQLWNNESKRFSLVEFQRLSSPFAAKRYDRNLIRFLTGRKQTRKKIRSTASKLNATRARVSNCSPVTNYRHEKNPNDTALAFRHG